MGMGPAIEHGKERRKPWYDSRAFDGSCRNHHGCPWCERARLYQRRRKEMDAAEAIDEFYSYACERNADGRPRERRAEGQWRPKEAT
jgi:hypothetical protein